MISLISRPGTSGGLTRSSSKLSYSYATAFPSRNARSRSHLLSFPCCAAHLHWCAHSLPPSHLERITPIWNVHQSGHRPRPPSGGAIMKFERRGRRGGGLQLLQGERVQHACSVARSVAISDNFDKWAPSLPPFLAPFLAPFLPPSLPFALS